MPLRSIAGTRICLVQVLVTAFLFQILWVLFYWADSVVFFDVYEFDDLLLNLISRCIILIGHVGGLHLAPALPPNSLDARSTELDTSAL